MRYLREARVPLGERCGKRSTQSLTRRHRSVKEKTNRSRADSERWERWDSWGDLSPVVFVSRDVRFVENAVHAYHAYRFVSWWLMGFVAAMADLHV